MKKVIMNFKVIGYGLWVMVALLVSAPVTAQNAQEWQSTSVMQTSGSAYSPQMTAVGATTVTSSVTTTESYSPAKGPNRAKKDFDGGTYEGGGTNPGETGFQDPGSPIGDAMLPLLALACVYAVYSVARVYRRKRRV